MNYYSRCSTTSANVEYTIRTRFGHDLHITHFSMGFMTKFSSKFLGMPFSSIQWADAAPKLCTYNHLTTTQRRLALCDSYIFVNSDGESVKLCRYTI